MKAKEANQNDLGGDQKCEDLKVGNESNIEFNPSISINVVHIDYSMIRIYNEAEITVEDDDDVIFEYQDSPAPVIRIFGSTCNEQRACVHIHGVSTLFLLLHVS